MSASDSDLPDAAAVRRRKFGAVRAVMLGSAVVLAVALTGLWLERKPIASSYIDRELAAHGVPARYRIADLGFGRQRLTDVVIGDPAHPDLVADWIELHTAVGLSGVHVTAVRAGHVRLRGRLFGGRVSLGVLDRLLPAPSEKPFALPALDAEIADARIRLETPQDLFGVKVGGRGRLDIGFTGQVAVASDRVETSGCVATGAGAVMAVHIAQTGPSLRGPMRVARALCAGAQIDRAGADLTATFSPALDHWHGTATLTTGPVRHPSLSVAALGGWIDFAGTPDATQGMLKLDGGRFETRYVTGVRLGTVARYRIGKTVTISPDSFVEIAGASLRPPVLQRIAHLSTGAGGTPIAPLAGKLAQSIAAAGRSFSGSARVGWSQGGPIAIGQILFSSASGVNAAFNDAVIRYDPARGIQELRGALAMGGGGLPALDATLVQEETGAPVTGTATLRTPYTATGASLMLAPVRFSAAQGSSTRIVTEATLSGPLGDGRIEGLHLPLDIRRDGAGRLVVNPACAPFSFQGLAVSGLALRPASLAACPARGAMIDLDDGTLRGGVTIASPRLSGAIGSSPLSLAAARATAQFGRPGFSAIGLAARIGAADRVTGLDIAQLDGRLTGGVLAGHFAGAAGQIGNVPLLLSRMTGGWSLRGGTLAIKGTLAVDDAAVGKRFATLDGRDVALTLRGDKIAATGTLVTPAKGIEVARVTIAHDLAQGSGHADLDVPGITLGPALQPDDLTKLTKGVVADVAGTVSGEGHIRWTPGGVTSDGRFHTAKTDLAAAIGPVTGIAGEIHFTDLLALQSAPGQVATVASINPGVPVTDGTIRYQTLPDARIRIEDARWPFAGGTLLLEPTLLDFGAEQERHMTFRVTGLDAAQFLQQFDFKNLNATGTFDGVLPMVFDTSGGRIENGHLSARRGGGTIAYVGDLTEKDLGFWGNTAFQTLKSLTYRSVDIVMNGSLAGEMVTDVRFAGVGQGVGAKRNFLVSRLARLPFVFNVRIKAPFRGLIDSAQSFYDPKRILDQQRDALALPTTGAVTTPVQPTESRKMP